MKKVFTGLLLSLGLASMSFASESTSTTAPKGNIEAGKAAAAVCAGCHGADGNSSIAQFPKLAGQGEAYLVKQLRDMKSGERVVSMMTPFVATMDDQTMLNLAAYFSSQTITQGVANADLVELGEQLYRGGNPETGVPACSACHSPTGAGNPAAKFPALASQHADYVSAQLKAFRDGYRLNEASDSSRINDGDTKIMRGVAFNLKDFEIEALASYIQGLYADY